MTAAETSRDVRAVVAEPRDGGASSRLADDAVLVPDAGGVGRWWRHYCFLLSTQLSQVSILSTVQQTCFSAKIARRSVGWIDIGRVLYTPEDMLTSIFSKCPVSSGGA